MQKLTQADGVDYQSWHCIKNAIDPVQIILDNLQKLQISLGQEQSHFQTRLSLCESWLQNFNGEQGRYIWLHWHKHIDDEIWGRNELYIERPQDYMMWRLTWG